MALLYRMGSGNGGSDLKPYKVTVNVDSEFNGTTVTLYQSGQTDLTATATNGKAIFYPMNSGVWRAKATYSTYEYYDTENGVDLSYFGDNYELNISLGNAIITVDWESVFNGATCTLTNGNKTFTHQLGTSGTWVQKVNEDGNWVASAKVQSGTSSGQTFSGNVNVNGSGNYSISLATSLVVTLWGASNETITINGTDIYTTDSEGKVENVTVCPNVPITLVGSVSGETFTKTLSGSATDLYCMPDGAVYWYGCLRNTIDMSGWESLNSEWTNIYSATQNVNSIRVQGTGAHKYDVIACFFGNPINVDNFTKVKVKYSNSTISAGNMFGQVRCFYLSDRKSLNQANANAEFTNITATSGEMQFSLNGRTQIYVAMGFQVNAGNSGTVYIDCLWLE